MQVLLFIICGKKGLRKPRESESLLKMFSFPLRCFFYLVTPEETMPESVDHVPDVISMIIPYFVVIIAIEAMVSVSCKQNDCTK